MRKKSALKRCLEADFDRCRTQNRDSRSGNAAEKLLAMITTCTADRKTSPSRRFDWKMWLSGISCGFLQGT